MNWLNLVGMGRNTCSERTGISLKSVCQKQAKVFFTTLTNMMKKQPENSYHAKVKIKNNTAPPKGVCAFVFYFNLIA